MILAKLGGIEIAVFFPYSCGECRMIKAALTWKGIQIMKTFLCMSTAALVVLTGPVCAEELSFSYGADLTTDYISKGSTQTENRPALQAYLDVSYGLFYAGIWTSNVRFGGGDDFEYDLYVGITPEWGDVAFDIGFAQYLYVNDKLDYGEAYVKGDWSVSDDFTLGADYYREVYADQNWLYVNAAYSALPWELTVSGGIGTDLGSQNLSSSKIAADIGLSRDLSDHAAIDLRFYGGRLVDETVTLAVSFFN
ncbi:MAG: TorF family putative porin [Paracoccaceae bacterium]